MTDDGTSSTRSRVYLESLKQLPFIASGDPGSIPWMIHRLHKLANVNGWAFFILGASTVGMSVVLSVISMAPDDLFLIEKSVVVGVLSGSIAFLTGLLTFVKPEHTWRVALVSEVALRTALTEWEMAVLEAEANEDEQQAIQHGTAATTRLMSTVRLLHDGEINDFIRTQAERRANASPTNGGNGDSTSDAR